MHLYPRAHCLVAVLRRHGHQNGLAQGIGDNACDARQGQTHAIRTYLDIALTLCQRFRAPVPDQSLMVFHSLRSPRFEADMCGSGRRPQMGVLHSIGITGVPGVRFASCRRPFDPRRDAVVCHVSSVFSGVKAAAATWQLRRHDSFGSCQRKPATWFAYSLSPAAFTGNGAQLLY